jgi:hypothetical protein
MNLDLTDDEAAALLRELDGRIDGDRYFMSPRIKTPGSHPRQDQAGAGARTIASAAEAIYATAGNGEDAHRGQVVHIRKKLREVFP